MKNCACDRCIAEWLRCFIATVVMEKKREDDAQKVDGT